MLFLRLLQDLRFLMEFVALSASAFVTPSLGRCYSFHSLAHDPATLRAFAFSVVGTLTAAWLGRARPGLACPTSAHRVMAE